MGVFYIGGREGRSSSNDRAEEDLSSGKSESTHPSRTVIKLIEVFYGVESVVRGNADSLLN